MSRKFISNDESVEQEHHTKSNAAIRRMGWLDALFMLNVSLSFLPLGCFLSYVAISKWAIYTHLSPRQDLSPVEIVELVLTGLFSLALGGLIGGIVGNLLWVVVMRRFLTRNEMRCYIHGQWSLRVLKKTNGAILDYFYPPSSVPLSPGNVWPPPTLPEEDTEEVDHSRG